MCVNFPPFKIFLSLVLKSITPTTPPSPPKKTKYGLHDHFDTYLVTREDNSCVIWLLRFGKISATPGGSNPIFCFNLSASFICCLLSQMISAKDSHHSWMVSKLLLNCAPLPCSCCSRFQRINSSSRTRDCKVLRCEIVSFNLSASVSRSCTRPATCNSNIVIQVTSDASLYFNTKAVWQKTYMRKKCAWSYPHPQNKYHLIEVCYLMILSFAKMIQHG